MAEASLPSPPRSLASIILSMGLIAVGNGLMFAYIPVRLADQGFAPWLAGATITALSAGGIAGCLCTGPLIQRVGHARVFASLAAIVVLSVLMIAVGTLPLLWIASRVFYGFAVNGLFIVSQSWLNDATPNEWRGKVIALFYMTYVISLGLGAFVLSLVPLAGPTAPLVTIFFITLGILPVGLTRLRTPPPPETVSVALRETWRISPVGLAGLLVVGGLTMLVQGFTPIYAAAVGHPKDDIALLMLLMQFGMIAVQFPFGALSDRVDRRYVLIAACLIVTAGAAVASRMETPALLWLVVVFALWSGATESIYAVATAHANDRADPSAYVALSSTLLVAWSVSGFVLPGLATVLTQLVGPEAYMFVTMAVAAAYGVFVVWRVTRREPAPAGAQEPYQPISAQLPLTAELAPQPPEETAD